MREPVDIRNKKDEYRLNGEVLRIYRVAKGLTYSELAERAGIGAKMLQAVELDRRNFSRATEKRVIENLGITEAQFTMLYAIKVAYTALDYL